MRENVMGKEGNGVLSTSIEEKKESVTTILAWLWRNRIIYFSWTDAIKPSALQQRKLEKLICRRKFMWLLIAELFERQEVHGCYSTVLPLVLEHLLCYRHTVTERSERKVRGSCLVRHST
jgi:hypothetical protein